MANRLSTEIITAGVLFLLAALTALFITLAFVAPESQDLFVILLRAPGQFLVESFHLTALYVPAILCVAAGLLLAERLLRMHLALLVLSIVPFFTVATTFRLAADAAVESSPVTAALEGAFGRGGAVAITVLLALIEVAALGLYWYRGRSERSPANSAAAGPSDVTDGDMAGGMRRIRALLAAPSRAPAEAPRSLVDLPDPAFEPETADLTEPADTTSDRDLTPDDVLEYAPVSIAVRAADADPAVSDSEEPLSLLYRDGAFVEADDSYEDDDEEDEDVEDDWDDEVIEPVVLVPRSRQGASEGSSDAISVPSPRSKRYDVPIDGLLNAYADKQYWLIDDKTREAAETLRVTLDEFGIQAEVTGIRKGPVITMFEILPAPGVKLSKIVNLSDNIALRLAASSVRIVAPIPGKHAVGIEIPNKERAIVGFAELLQEDSFQNPRAEIPIALGKDIPGDAQIVDLTKMPHVLIAGATGSGKSVCVNSIICSILYRRAPHEVKLILIDPKIVELKFYNDIPHLLTPVITDPKRAFQALQYCIYEMERRYSLLDALQVRDIQSYNKKIKTKKLATEPIPYIVVVVDEFADLMATSGKELESTLARLAAMSRAVGIHLVLATQRPSTDVITGLIKANIPSRIAFMVASKVDSRIILDAMGADKLLGRGDMLFTSAWDPFPTRMQGAFLSEEEVERVVTYVKQLGEPDYIDDEIFVDDDDEDFVQGELEDPLMEKAIEIVQTAGKASASYLQRRLKVGYNRAARMVEEMERVGIVGPQQGSKPRDVIGSGERF